MKNIATFELEGEKYAVVPMKDYQKLVSRSGSKQAAREEDDSLPPMPSRRPNGDYPAIEAARVSIARDVIHSRKAVGLGQAELARRAGIRVETLNRIERAKVTADVATMKKIERALSAAARRRAG
jgi:ribosome-binding protein aMBF1 (putative translation factor)